MKVQLVVLCEFPAPVIVDQNGSAKLRRLHDNFDFTAILCSLALPFCKKKVDRPLFVSFATLKESVIFENAPQTTLHRSPFK